MSGGVVRVGDTVRRPAGPWTPAVHALLAHLHAAGFQGAPRPLGTDERGREVLTFIPGPVAWPDHFHRLDGDGELRRAARLIRGFHDAVAGFTPPPGARWQVLMPADGDEIIAHHDLAPWNLVMGERQWAFIDWDTAAPGTRLWDLAYAMHGFAPLSADPAFQLADVSRRLRLIADAYGPHRTAAPRHHPAARPAHPGDARVPRPAGRAGHPAVGAAMARRARRRLAGRHALHHRARRPVAPGAPGLARRAG
jgi:hypothetical protein